MYRIFSFTKAHTTASVFLGILLFFAVTSFFSFLRFRSAHYFGSVVSTTPQQVVISDKRVGVQEFQITDKTKIRSGKRVQEKLNLGQEVMVVAKPVGTSSLEALEIRVFESRN